MPSDLLLPEDVFTNGVGRFWGFVRTRDYMRARFAAADALLKANTAVSVRNALEHFKDMLRLCRGDNMGVRDIVPGLMLRLGQEQECYDFLKWWATTGSDGEYDWGDTSLPYLDIHNADAFEPINTLGAKNLSLTQLAVLALLKLRLYLDLEAIGSRESDLLFGNYGGYSGGFDVDQDESVLDRPLGQIAKARVRSRNRPDISGLAQRIKGQYHALCQMVHDANQYFWEALIDEETPVPPATYSSGSREEADLAVHQCKAAWEESEDAILMIETDTSKYISEYTGVRGDRTDNAGDGGARQSGASGRRPEKLPIRRGTGQVLPSAFNGTSDTTPEDLFNLSPLGGGTAARFLHRNSQSSILLYTDGACLNNGQPDPRAGWAVVYGPANVLSGRLEEKGPFGDECPATSNRAELRAVIAALRFRDWRADGFDSITIASDSSYVIDGATGWVRGWFRNGWKTRNGGDVKNKDLWELLLGEVERWEEQGVTVKLWNIPRELNTLADSAAKAAANEAPVEEFRDVAIGLSQTTTTTHPLPGSRIIALCLEEGGLFEACFGSLVTEITSKANLEQVTTAEAAIRMLSHDAAPSVILITDGAIARQKKVFECVADCLSRGTTVVLCGCFSGMVNEGQFSRVFAKLGLSWTRGSYHRGTVNLRRDAVEAETANRLPGSYSQKAQFVTGLDQSAIWYAEHRSSTEAAVAFAKVGQGRLGYIGDVNGEEASNTVVMAMCGLLG